VVERLSQVIRKFVGKVKTDLFIFCASTPELWFVFLSTCDFIWFRPTEMIKTVRNEELSTENKKLSSQNKRVL